MWGIEWWGPPLAAYVLGRGGGGGGGDLSDEQKSLANAQTAIARLTEEIMRSRHALTGPTFDESGQAQGPIVDALLMALNNANRTQARPRQRLRNTPFDPFAEPRS